jgi:hypothetical protein
VDRHRVKGIPVQTLSEDTATVSVFCVECGEPVPVTVEVAVVVCDCGGNHQTLACVPNLLDVELHILTHEQEAL